MAYQISIPYLGSGKPTVQRVPTPHQVCPISGESQFEELVNCLTHGFGLLLSVGGLVFLMSLAVAFGNRWHVIGCGVYGVTLVMAYAASTLYHGSGSLTQKRLFRRVDQTFVYLLIAGTYTPFTLVPLHGGWGWSLLTVVWAMALAGVGANLVFLRWIGGASVPAYLGLGWLSVIAIVPLRDSLPLSGVILLVAGGVAYTLGTVFLVRKPLPFSHGLWHIAVLLGSACHYLAVVLYVIPWA